MASTTHQIAPTQEYDGEKENEKEKAFIDGKDQTSTEDVEVGAVLLDGGDDLIRESGMFFTIYDNFFYR